MRFALFTGLETGTDIYLNPEQVHLVGCTDSRQDGGTKAPGSFIVYGPQAQSVTVKELPLAVIRTLQAIAKS